MKIKMFIFALVFLLSATLCLADQKVYDVDKSVIVPKYVVKDRPDGTKVVYKSSNPVLPVYVVKPTRDGYKVYDVNQSVIIPKFEIEGGKDIVK